MPIDYKQFSHPGIQSLVPYKPGKSIEELAKERNITDIIKLASNENPLGCSPLAYKALQNMSPHVIATYPSPINHPLMPKLAQKLKVDTNEVFVSNGSDYLFGMLLYSFALSNGKHILTHEYSFSTYAIQAKTLNIPVREVPIKDNWAVDIDQFINACNTDTALIFIANPNNPTGLLIEQSEIKRLLDNIPASTLLVLDEAYYEYAAKFFKPDSIEWIHNYPNLVITRTFSKIYGMAGLRLGYAIANSEIISILRRVQLPFAVNQVALAAAFAALDDEEFIQTSINNNNAGMVQILNGLAQLKLSHIPTVCNFVTIDCQKDALTLYNFLLDKGIIVRPLHAYAMNDYIRVTVGTKEQNMRFLQALNQYFL